MANTKSIINFAYSTADDGYKVLSYTYNEYNEEGIMVRSNMRKSIGLMKTENSDEIIAVLEGVKDYIMQKESI